MTTAKSKEYQRLIAKRENYVRALTYHEPKIKEMSDEVSQVNIKTRLTQIEASYDKYTTITLAIEDSDEFETTDLDPTNEEIVEKYIVMASKLNALKKENVNSFVCSSLNTTVTPRNTEPVTVKLPPLPIPTFNGSYEQWQSFRNNWKSIVESQTTLPDIVKMHYLKTHLSDSALSVVRELPNTDAAYKLAWELLDERFNNKRAITNACLNTFINQPKISHPNVITLRKLIDTSKQSLEILKTLEINIDSWDAMIVFIIQSKLDTKTLKAWESHLHGSTRVPTFDSLSTFLETEYRICENSSNPIEIAQNVTPSCSTSKDNSIPNSKEKSNTTTTHRDISNTTRIRKKCPACPEKHWLGYCHEFDSWAVPHRIKFVNDKILCKICLNSHSDACRSKHRCQTCNGEHNTKLHLNSSDHHAIQCNNQNNKKLLATAMVKVKDRCGTYHLLRAFIDQGSEGALITERAMQLLNLPRTKDTVTLSGIDDRPLGQATSSARIQIQSIVNSSFEMSMEVLVQRSIMKSRIHTANDNWKHLENIKLADPEFWRDNPIDLLFGVDIYGIIIENGIRKGKINEPVAQNSTLGWLVFGAMLNENSLNIRINTLSLSESLERFWENEQVSTKRILTEEQQKCVEYCNKTLTQLPNGRLQVAIPFNMDPNAENFLGDSRRMALKRLFHLEKKFEKYPEYHQRYNEDILSYINNNQMAISQSHSDEGYYLPHHAVVREDSVTTKQRTVFDGSAKSSNGFSLNDRCLNGPTIQPDLFDTFVRWRMNKVALKTDIEKMYRQIKIPPEDRKFLKILYRFTKNEPIKTYELKTVTFGIKPSPYMAIASTFYLANAYKDKYPEASERIKTDFYVDDGLSGSHSIESAHKLQQDLNTIFNSAHLPLRKWASNEEAALEGIPIESRAIKSSIKLNLQDTIKTVGMGWTPTTDELSFSVDMTKLTPTCKRITKRQLLSDASKLYDPCGILSPITIKSKIIMQEVWKSGINWDSFVNPNIQSEWNTYRNELPIIESLKINRWFNTSPESQIYLHGFSDSSEKAMAAVVYLVQTKNGITTSSIICSKTRVAPLNPETIPRLELNGAVLLANLVERIANNLQIAKQNIHLWTDSAIVLHWLNSHASKWKTYVSHRVNEIQNIFGPSHWHHVSTHDNPADMASRGIFPSQLKENHLWLHGPSWLLSPENQWPKLIYIIAADEKTEEKSQIKMNAISIKTNFPELELLSQFDNFNKLIRTTARCLRFMKNASKKETLKYSKEFVTTNELDRAKQVWVKHVQSLYFKDDIKSIQLKGEVNDKSTLKTLCPQLNENGVLILHGRLEKAEWNTARKFPMILPSKNHFTTLIIDHAHKSTLHGTIHLTLARVRQEYWPINGRNEVKSFIHKCLRCFRMKPTPIHQLMAPLPIIKTKPARAFAHCGMDFAGPIEIKRSDLRNAQTVKTYICVFVCMASKAIHLELVGDYTSNKFILALRRMMARRGLCSDIYCDQGTNFEGASNEIPRLFLQANSNVSVEIRNKFTNDGIKFHFLPPSAPNWGGQWESFVKLTKHHLYRMTTHFKFTYEEMSTLLTQIEACVNSRPLCAMSNDINDLDPLTAGHLLIGSPLNLLPEPNLLDLEENRLDRFQSIQRSMQMFWKRFAQEYLHTLHPRKKWYKPQTDLAIGDLVSIIDEEMPPGKWLMARVIDIHPSADGYIRLVTLRTKTSTLQRPIVKLCKFPFAPAPPEDVRDQTNNKI